MLHPPSHLVNVMVMFHRRETVSLTHNGKVLENIYVGKCDLQQTYKKDTLPTIILPGFC